MARETLEQAEADWNCRNCGTPIRGDAGFKVVNSPRRRGAVVQVFPRRYHAECYEVLAEASQAQGKGAR